MTKTAAGLVQRKIFCIGTGLSFCFKNERGGESSPPYGKMIFTLKAGMLLVCVSSFAASAVFSAILIFVCRKKGWYDTVDERKIHRGNIPRLGGI